MTKFKDFKELVKNNVGVAEDILTADICYAMGILKYDDNVEISLYDLDDSYDKEIWIRNLGTIWEIRAGGDIVLGSISNTYERYQVARMLADLYLTFYQNYKVY